MEENDQICLSSSNFTKFTILLWPPTKGREKSGKSDIKKPKEVAVSERKEPSQFKAWDQVRWRPLGTHLF